MRQPLDWFKLRLTRLQTGRNEPELLEAGDRVAALRRCLTPDENWRLSAEGLGTRSTAGTMLEGPVAFEGLNELRNAIVQANTTLGLLSYLGYWSFLGTGTSLGRYCSVGMNATVGAGEHTVDWLTTHNFAREGRDSPPDMPLKVGHDVWIGAGAFVRAGLTIGHGAIIGAGTVVLEDVPPYAVVVGTPARIMRLRFHATTIERLLALEWWRLPLDHVRTLPFDDVDRCLDEVARLRTDLPAAALV